MPDGKVQADRLIQPLSASSGANDRIKIQSTTASGGSLTMVVELDQNAPFALIKKGCADAEAGGTVELNMKVASIERR